MSAEVIALIVLLALLGLYVRAAVRDRTIERRLEEICHPYRKDRDGNITVDQ